MPTPRKSNNGEQPPPKHVCSGCFAEFDWATIEFERHGYCCRGCADGGPCACTYNSPTTDAVTVSDGEPADQPEDAGHDDHAHPDAEPVTASSAPVPPAAPAGSPPANDDDAGHECANCLATFWWDPTAVNGKAYCCAGCGDGGPCSCTYEGPPQTAPESDPALVAVQAQEEMGPSRHDVLLAAIAEFPVNLRAVATLRVTRDVSVREIAAELGLDERSAEDRLDQGRALLTRTVGPEYRLEYTQRPQERIPGVGRKSLVAVAAAESAETGALASLVTESITTLHQVREAPTSGKEATSLEEAFGEAAEVFQEAARRMQLPVENRPSLRKMIRDRAGETRIVVSGLDDANEYLLALQHIDAVTNAVIESVEESVTVYVVEADPQRTLITGLIGMSGAYKPRSLRVAASRIEIALGPSGVFAAPAAQAGAEGSIEPAVVEASPQAAKADIATFELGAEAFFGARHYLSFGGDRGETHYHSWRVEVLFESDANDEEGTVLGFAEARDALEAKIADYNETLLNNVEPFDRIQPTAENIARVIFQDIAPGLARGATRLKTVRVWESPTNHAAYSVA
ncbi:MAG: 6-carboxytetrahydropterin synthase [Candidatus Krumholzibacteria bacterium]